MGRRDQCAAGPERVTEREKRGLSLLELCIAIALLSVIMMGMALGFGTSFRVVNGARRTTGGTKFLETVMQNVAAQPYDNLVAMNGNQFFDQVTLADSEFTVDLVVFQTEIDLLQVEATLSDLRTTRELGTVTTLRSQR